jgi:membrane-associated phospholipid phosphatase
MRLSFAPILLAVTLLLPGNAAAKSPHDYLDDLGDYALAPLRWDSADWSRAGVAAGGIALAYAADDDVRRHFTAGGARAGRDPHAWRDAAPLLALTAGTYALGRLRHDDAGTRLGLDMAEAGVFGLLSANALKFVAGRARPNESDRRSDWREGGDSFPSGHVTAAFAVAQVFADGMPREQWGWRVLAYGLAGATAYARLDGNVHWLSDTVAGAAIGLATGRFISRRGEAADATAPRVAVSVAPLGGGAMLSFQLRTD